MTIQPRRLDHIYDQGRAFTAAKRTCEEPVLCPRTQGRIWFLAQLLSIGPAPPLR